MLRSKKKNTGMTTAEARPKRPTSCTDANRVSASKLYEIAKSLQAPVAYFFEGLEATTDGVSEGGEPFVHDFLMTSEGLELATQFPRITRSRVRRRILELVRSMAEEEASEDD